MREPLGTSGLKEEAAGAVGEYTLCKLSHRMEGETDYRRHKALGKEEMVVRHS
jgi:hypothetical protein